MERVADKIASTGKAGSVLLVLRSIKLDEVSVDRFCQLNEAMAEARIVYLS